MLTLSRFADRGGAPRRSPIEIVATMGSYLTLTQAAEVSGLRTGPFGRWADGVTAMREDCAAFARHWKAHNDQVLAEIGPAQPDGPLWVVLGDSTAQGLGALSPDGGYVGQVLAELRRQTGLPWRVLNLRHPVHQPGQAVRLPAHADCGPPGPDRAARPAAARGLLGLPRPRPARRRQFHRMDRTENEPYFLSGFKTFRSEYTVVPVYGSPKNLSMPDANSVKVELSTGNPDEGTHGVYFNRGVAASQAYATRFGAAPDSLPPDKRAEAMTWLSRGLHEAMIAFITRDASPGLAILAAVYEFTEPTVLAAFAKARAAGADVRIVFHDKGDQGQANEDAIKQANLDPAMLIKRTHPVIAHNKFIIRCDHAADGSLAPKELWTGSTNLSQGGIFGHSNVGHAVRDATVADAYLEYWTELSADPTGKPLKQWVSAHSPFAAEALSGAGIHTLFSPRTALDPLDWYAQRFTAAAAGSTHLTLPFGLDNKHFEPRLTAVPASDATLRYVMLDQADDHQAIWSANHAVQVAVGSEGGPGSLTRWARERLTGFNAHVPYLHTKILLVSPLAAAPVVISGSANFSEASTTDNDENMLIVVGDTDVADVYFTEYARIFQHFYARWWAAHLDPHGSDTHSFLTEDDSWQQRYFDPKSPKYAERLLYSSQVQDNVS